MFVCKIAGYALADVLRSLESEGITSCTITKEDGNLEIILTKKDLYPYLQIRDNQNFSRLEQKNS